VPRQHAKKVASKVSHGGAHEPPSQSLLYPTCLQHTFSVVSAYLLLEMVLTTSEAHAHRRSSLLGGWPFSSCPVHDHKHDKMRNPATYGAVLFAPLTGLRATHQRPITASYSYSSLVVMAID
jgi:hypothetical protein